MTTERDSVRDVRMTPSDASMFVKAVFGREFGHAWCCCGGPVLGSLYAYLLFRNDRRGLANADECILYGYTI